MVLANLRDRAAAEWGVLDRELASYGRDAYNMAMRHLGYAGMAARSRRA
jgi:hypothetical protein